jgi:hypothetical protein
MGFEAGFNAAPPISKGGPPLMKRLQLVGSELGPAAAGLEALGSRRELGVAGGSRPEQLALGAEQHTGTQGLLARRQHQFRASMAEPTIHPPHLHQGLASTTTHRRIGQEPRFDHLDPALRGKGMHGIQAIGLQLSPQPSP